MVKSILVSEGQAVTKGQALIELDSTLTFADKKRLSGELNSEQMQLAVSRAFLQLLETPEPKQKNIKFSSLSLGNIPGAKQQEVLLHKKLHWQQWQQYRAELQTLKSAVTKTSAEWAVTREIITKLEQTLPITAPGVPSR